MNNIKKTIINEFGKDSYNLFLYHVEQAFYRGARKNNTNDSKFRWVKYGHALWDSMYQKIGKMVLSNMENPESYSVDEFRLSLHDAVYDSNSSILSRAFGFRVMVEGSATLDNNNFMEAHYE